ncbi:MAG: hypothetical protein RMZ69_32605 [Nostoc sp. ChiQUE01a]|nr:hypothetical protein [Nostoc sp. ChiQUE01a]
MIFELIYVVRVRVGKASHREASGREVQHKRDRQRVATDTS